MSDGWLSASGHSLEFVGVSAAQARTSLRWSRSKEVNYDFPPPPCAALTRTTATLDEPAVMPTSRSRRRRRQLWQPILRLSSQACVGSLPFTPDEAVIYAAREEFQPLRSIGIMTMHRIFNYGSSLQGYGLRRLIEGLDGDVTVSFVDFKPGEILVTENGARTPTTRFERALRKAREYNEVDARLSDKVRFINHKRTYAARNFPLLGLNEQPNHGRELDVLVIGSDEVFNCVQSNTNVGYSRDLFGHGSSARKTISYAGSFGNTTLEMIDTYGIRKDLAEDFARFESISVRDRNSAQIIEELTGQQPVLNVDPVLAHEFMQLEPRIPSARQHDGKYIIVYGYSGRLTHDENEVLKDYARGIGAEILCFGGVQECCDRFVDCNPFELLAYFRDAEAIITDTFHGTIFAIINNRPFGTIIRPSVGLTYGNEEKLSFLLELFDLTSQRVTDMTQVEEILGNEVDYDAVGETLTGERMRALEYLESAIR